MAFVPKAIYIVIFSQGKWWVDFEGKAVGPFPDKEAAARDAMRIAKSHKLDERPFEIWMALPEGLQRLGVAAMRERYPAAPFVAPAPIAAAPILAAASASLPAVSIAAPVPQAPPVSPALPPAPALVTPPSVFVASPLPPAAMPPMPTRLPPAPALF
jgi:hypothetical protein